VVSKTIKEIIKNKDDLKIINEIQNIRAKNNVCWMDILKLAIKTAPKEAKKIMQKINKYDALISKLTKELTNGKS
jgi:hypothetical protein